MPDAGNQCYVDENQTVRIIVFVGVVLNEYDDLLNWYNVGNIFS